MIAVGEGLALVVIAQEREIIENVDLSKTRFNRNRMFAPLVVLCIAIVKLPVILLALATPWVSRNTEVEITS